MASAISEASGSIPDESTYMSEDSESTQGSELDYDITVDVLLPDNTIQKATIAASTPWSDLRPQLCSQFKLSPSSHVVDYISSSSYKLKQRRASRSVGKMDITMITIQSKNHPAKTAITPHPASNNKENTVRLIIRLARLRQSIIRVNPDIALADIFETVCTKLKLSPDAKKCVEFHHPVQQDVKLSLSLSLNHYNIREIYLVEKTDVSKSKPIPSSGKTKRKAPPPPRPAPPALLTQSKVKPASTETERKSAPVEPVYASIQKKPKPAKRRAAPPPPAATNLPSHDKDEKEKDPLPSMMDVDDFNKPKPQTDVEESCSEKIVNESVTDHTKPTRPPRIHKHLKTSLDEDNLKSSSSSFNEDTDSVNKEVSSQDETVYQVIDDSNITKIPDKEENIDEEAADVIELFNNVIEESEADAKSSDEKNTSGDFVQPPNDADVTEVHDPATAMKFGDIIVYDVADADESIDQDAVVIVENNGNILPHQTTDDIEGDVISSDTLTTNTAAKEETEIPFDDFPPPPPSLYEDKELPSPTMILSEKNDRSSPTHIDSQISQTAETVHEEILISETMSLSPTAQEQPTKSQPQNGFVKKVQEEDDGFDLHIAESFNIPIRSIDEEKIEANGRIPQISNSKVEETHKMEASDKQALHQDIVAPSAPEKNNENIPSPAVDKTVMEIEKLHLQIKKMRHRNSAKQKDIESRRNTWQPGSRSFTFVPEKKKVVDHPDYHVAPTSGIELSNDGEIKTLHTNTPTEQEKPVEVSAPKLRSTLPSYYKKFLGVQAFAAEGRKK